MRRTGRAPRPAPPASGHGAAGVRARARRASGDRPGAGHGAAWACSAWSSVAENNKVRFSGDSFKGAERPRPRTLRSAARGRAPPRSPRVTAAPCEPAENSRRRPCRGRLSWRPHMANSRALPRVLDLDQVRTQNLTNGLRIRVMPERSAPTLSYYTFFQVGSRNERLGTTGISHLFEHMMFNGAARYGPKEFDRVLESRGGSSNAYTSNDVTAYYEDFASDALETVLDLESDRMRSLRLTSES